MTAGPGYGYYASKYYAEARNGKAASLDGKAARRARKRREHEPLASQSTEEFGEPAQSPLSDAGWD